MGSLLLKLLAFGAIAATALLVGGLLANRVPLTKPPGLERRLLTYLTANVAQTAENSSFPELRPRAYGIPAQRLYALVQEAVRGLGWEVVATSDERLAVGAVVTTPLWRFKDDVTVRVTPGEGGKSLLSVRSASRVGKGDLGANTRHILDLYDAIDARATRARPELTR